MALGLTAAVFFVLLASVRIEAQGPQYDELHQAVERVAPSLEDVFLDVVRREAS